MSLQYIIDAYNLTNHPAFKPASGRSVNIQQALVDFIRSHKLTGSTGNLLVLVFDGYPPSAQEIPQDNGLLCLFSRGEEADALIRKIVEKSASPKNIVVVSDDKEVQLASRLLRARVCAVREFICGKKDVQRSGNNAVAAEERKLSYVKMQKINAELKARWLK